jgi:hypothetical protein
VCLRGATLVEEEALRVGVGEFHRGREALTHTMDQTARRLKPVIVQMSSISSKMVPD